VSNARRSRSTAHLPGLDGLRAVACLMVFAVHFGQIAGLRGYLGPFNLARLLENGNSGVALFFALSGFLLSRPYWLALGIGAALPKSGQYFTRRMARIVPAYFLCLTTLIIANRLWQEDDWLRNVFLHYAFAFNYLDATIFSINPPFWTIAVEVQFYLLLPLMFAACRRLKPATAALFIVALALAVYGVHLMLILQFAKPLDQHANVSPVLTYSLLAHLPHFLLGVLTAWLFNSRNFSPWTPSKEIAAGREITMWIILTLLIAILGTSLDDLLQIPYGRYNLPFVPLLLCTVILLTPLTATGWVLFESPPLRLIGTISYSIYIFHLPILHAGARLMTRFSLNPHENWFIFGGASLGTTLAIATGSYLLVERPILRLSKQ
jgi:peptidoglycan/LPS O-acetylase OafA/YrhL